MFRIQGGQQFAVSFDRQKTGFGEKRFFLCPECDSRRSRLYIYGNRLLCRECYPYPLYKGIKNVTRGGYDYIMYRMIRLASKEGIILKKWPFYYYDYQRPKNKQLQTWKTVITKLQALENMRNQAIFFKKRYSNEVINSVISGENRLLYSIPLVDMERYFYDWENGLKR